MKILILTLALFLAACGTEDTEKEKPVISKQEYDKLKQLSAEELLVKASSGELGACTIEAVNCHDMVEGCGGGNGIYHFVKLSDLNVFYPSMDPDKADLKSIHGQYPQTYVKAAFNAGYCYNVELQ